MNNRWSKHVSLIEKPCVLADRLKNSVKSIPIVKAKYLINYVFFLSHSKHV